MPVYNAEKYVREALESILKQTYDNIEILIIDDGSIDNSVSIITSYVDPRILLVRNNTNMKLVPTLNKGISLANGIYIARMDADDIAAPTRIEKQVHFMQAHPDVAVCGTGAKMIGSRMVFVPLTKPESIKYKLYVRNCIVHPTVMIRISVLRDNNLSYDEMYIHTEDYDLWTRLSENHKIANIRSPLLFYRLNEEGISRRYVHEQGRLTAKIATDALRRIGIEWAPEQLQKMVLSKNDILEAKELIKRMVEGVVDQKFKSVLWFLWLDICSRGANHGMWIIKIFYSIHQLRVPVSVLENIKFIVKALRSSVMK
jgi:glycosyltransferase involved in cell wall biosynthesis